jgi:amino-acid N-acetyltransferase
MNGIGGERRIRNAVTADWNIVRALLLASDLPVEDLDAEKLERFLLATAQADGRECILGVVGLESYGKVGLLRSLVVDAAARGTGCGSYLVNALERKSSAEGISELWLLTIDADGFFASRRYSSVSRDDAPSAIRDTVEFSSLCPDSAVLMSKSLR